MSEPFSMSAAIREYWARKDAEDSYVGVERREPKAESQDVLGKAA